MSEKGWWEVRTGAPNDEQSGDSVLLGKFFGYIDDIAFRLADKQCGFWCAGALYFRPCQEPKLPSKEAKDTVNVVLRTVKWNNGPDLLEKMQAEFQNRPVEVLDCNLYGTVTLKRK